MNTLVFHSFMVTAQVCQFTLVTGAVVKYPASLFNSEILSFGCRAVAHAAAPFLMSVKSFIASCFQLHVLFSVDVTNL